MTSERPLNVGERIKIGANEGIVRSIEPILGKAELHRSRSSRERASTRSYARAKYGARR